MVPADRMHAIKLSRNMHRDLLVPNKRALRVVRTSHEAHHPPICSPFSISAIAVADDAQSLHEA